MWHLYCIYAEEECLQCVCVCVCVCVRVCVCAYLIYIEQSVGTPGSIHNYRTLVYITAVTTTALVLVTVWSWSLSGPDHCLVWSWSWSANRSV